MASGIATNRTNLEIPKEVSSLILQSTQEQSAIMRLATRIDLPGRGLMIPVITSDPEAEWVSETGVKPVKNPGLDKKNMQAYKLAVIVPFSMEFRRDENALFNALVSRLPGALAKKFDETCFHGSAPGSNFDTLASCTAQSISSNTYDSLVAADQDIALHDGILNGWVISPQARGILLTAKDYNQRPIFINNVADEAIPRILGAPTYASKGAYKAGTPNVVGFAGDWTKAMYGVVQGVTVDMSEEATLVTGVTGAADINLWQQNMFAIRAEIEVGFVADTSCFNKLTASPSGATGATGGTGA